MIKFRIKKPKYHPDILMVGYDYEIVKKEDLPRKLNDGWTFVEKEYFILTNLLRQWNKSPTAEKSMFISMISLLVSILVAIFK